MYLLKKILYVLSLRDRIISLWKFHFPSKLRPNPIKYLSEKTKNLDSFKYAA